MLMGAVSVTMGIRVKLLWDGGVNMGIRNKAC